jgi:hypothetical protein
VLGTDSHTTMVNALSVIGWGAGGIEATAAALGQLRSQRVELWDELERMVLEEVESGRARGDFATDDAHEAGRAVLVLCRGVADWCTPGGPHRPEKIARRYVRFALALAGDMRG